MMIFIYGAFLCVLSTENNQLSSDNLCYAFSVLIAFGCLVGYGIYYSFWVRKVMKDELYKINNLFRLFGVLILSYGWNDALLFINTEEVFFIFFEITFYWNSKDYKLFWCV